MAQVKTLQSTYGISRDSKTHIDSTVYVGCFMSELLSKKDVWV